MPPLAMAKVRICRKNEGPCSRVLEHGPSFFLQILTFAIANGGIYALIALGYTMVYGIIELINFAHGDVFAFGAFLSASLIPVFGLGEDKPFGVLPALALLGVFVVRSEEHTSELQ